MAWNSRPGETQKAIIAQLLETDADLREEARALVLQGLRDLRNMQVRGDPAIRAKLASQLAGPITQFIMETGEGDENSTLRAEMHEMMEEMRAGIMGETPAPATPDPPVAKKLVPKK